MPGTNIVYKISNAKNGKFYIGKTNSPNSRLLSHIFKLKKGKHHCEKLQNDFNNQQGKGFYFEILKIFDSSYMASTSECGIIRQADKDKIYNTFLVKKDHVKYPCGDDFIYESDKTDYLLITEVENGIAKDSYIRQGGPIGWTKI